MYDGVMFLSKPFRSESDDSEDGKKYQFCLAVGRLVADPRIDQYNKRKTSFTIKYHTKQYCNIEIWGEGDCATIAATLEKDDVVLAIGTLTTKKYVVRKGELAGQEKEWTDLNPQILIPMPYITKLMEMCASLSLQKLIQKGESLLDEDPMESSGDFVDDEYMSLDEEDGISVDELFG